MEQKATLRHCKVCGLFYPADAGELRREIAGLMKEVEARSLAGTLRGLISPHAGYSYSGLTAAHGYRLLKGCTFDTVVIVSPSHREYFEGISAFPGTAYETPLGKVPVDGKLRERLIEESADVRLSVAGHREEHAIEVQLPFLQEILSDFMILPLVIGDQRREFCLELGRALAAILRDRNALLVASTDLSHFHSYDAARNLDSVVIEDIRRFDAEQLMLHLERGEAEACGGGPAVAIMTALRGLGATKMEILHHCKSGDVTGDRSSVVGYMSAAAYS